MRYLTPLLLLSSVLTAVEIGPYQVTQIIDGNTIQIKTDREEKIVRILYVDTTEPKKEQTETKSKETNAKDWLIKQLHGQKIKLWCPENEIKTGSLDKTNADILINTNKNSEKKPSYNGSISTLLIEQGYSVYWKAEGSAPEPLNKTLLKKQTAAKINKHGFWKTAPKWMEQRSTNNAQTQIVPKNSEHTLAHERYKEALKKKILKRNDRANKLYKAVSEDAFCNTNSCADCDDNCAP